MSGQLLRAQWITRNMVQRQLGTVFVFGDNMMRVGTGGQAGAMRGEPNAVGVPTKWAPGSAPADFFCDDDLKDLAVRAAILGAFAVINESLDAGRDVVIPADGLGSGLSELPTRAPAIYAFIEGLIAQSTNRALYVRQMGGTST